jgi:hypothetical protein
MLKLQSDELIVDIVDPYADRHLLGSRYCAGGYIFQVHDKQEGDLFSGPNFPDGSFSPFDGQGAPEVFVTALNGDVAKAGEDVLVPGVGRVTRTSGTAPFSARSNPHVAEFSLWEIEQRGPGIVMRTGHVFDKWDISIVRSVLLSGNALTSETALLNKGENAFPLRWFPHPFFPYPAGRVACRFGFPVAVPDNAGYFLNDRGWVEMNPRFEWDKGLYQPLILEQPALFTARQVHPLVNAVLVSCDYAPSFLPVWANRRTFSFEPYLEKTIDSGEEFSWKIEYRFGE